MADTTTAGTLAVRLLRSRWFDYAFAIACVVAAVIWSMLSGKDINWDQLNYHFYLPYSLFGDRVGMDYMPANGQSYLNPLLYVPFYWMVIHDWHSLLIASVLAGCHALNIVIAYFILRHLLPQNDLKSLAVAVLGAVLAFLSPIFLTEVGTTLADVSTATFVLAAVYCALNSSRITSLWLDRSLIAGLCIGAACGLKLSNLIFGPGLALLIVCMQSSVTRCIRALVLLGVGSLLGLAVAQGYWGYKLWQVFGNPFYPYFSSFFPASADFPQGSPHERFLADNLIDALSLPFRMTQLRSWIYIENVAPDLRFAALTLVFILGLVLLLTKHRASIRSVFSAKHRGLLALSLFFLISYVLWLRISGNGRYGMVLTILCGPLLAAAIWKISPRTDVVIGTLALVVLLQVFHLQNGDLRWARAEWTRTWYDVTVPQRLQQEPYLYISVGGNSNSYIYPFLAAGSTFTNPIGQISFDFDKPGGDRLKALFSKHEGRVRAIGMISGTDTSDEAVSAWIRSLDSMVSRLGYGVDATDCETLSAAGTPAEAGRDMDENAPKVRRFRTCRLFDRPFALAQERARVTKIAEEIAQWCPKLFKPAQSVVDRTPEGWTVNYLSTDSALIIVGDLIVARQAHSAADFSLGTLTSWEQGRRLECSNFPDKPRKKYTY